MNYYNFHIGDYRGATAHLTNDEDLCYRRLLDMYYDKEGILPDITTISRRIRIEESIVSLILAEFFQQTESGWIHQRAQKEIDAFVNHQEASKRGGKKSASNRTSDSKAPSTPLEGPLKAPSTPLQATNNQEPITNNHIPLTPNGGGVEGEVINIVKSPEQDRREVNFAKEAAEFQEFWNAYPEHRRTKLITAQREWVAMTHQRPPFSEIMAALSNHKASEDWSRDGGKFVPSAVNWITEQAWHERKAPAKKSSTPAASKAKPMPKVDASEAAAWLEDTYPIKAGTPFTEWPPNIQQEFLQSTNQPQTQAA
jgi:uncharacterized protein YdaU (DUF1376 family)